MRKRFRQAATVLSALVLAALVVMAVRSGRTADIGTWNHYDDAAGKNTILTVDSEGGCVHVQRLAWFAGRLQARPSMVYARPLQVSNWLWPHFSVKSAPVAELDDLVVPYWILILFSSILPVTWMWRKTSHPRGHCPRCGYDLRATPQRCPECGWQPDGVTM